MKCMEKIGRILGGGDPGRTPRKPLASMACAGKFQLSAHNQIKDLRAKFQLGIAALALLAACAHVPSPHVPTEGGSTVRHVKPQPPVLAKPPAGPGKWVNLDGIWGAFQ